LLPRRFDNRDIVSRIAIRGQSRNAPIAATVKSRSNRSVFLAIVGCPRGSHAQSMIVEESDIRAERHAPSRSRYRQFAPTCPESIGILVASHAIPSRRGASRVQRAHDRVPGTYALSFCVIESLRRIQLLYLNFLYFRHLMKYLELLFRRRCGKFAASTVSILRESHFRPVDISRTAADRRNAPRSRIRTVRLPRFSRSLDHPKGSRIASASHETTGSSNRNVSVVAVPPVQSVTCRDVAASGSTNAALRARHQSRSPLHISRRIIFRSASDA